MNAAERRARVSADAAEWWDRLQSSDLGRLERTEFVVWLRESPLHVEEILRVARVHDALERFERWSNIKFDEHDNTIARFPLESSREQLGQPLPVCEPGLSPEHLLKVGGERSRTKMALSALAASVVLVLSVVSLSPGWRGQTIETERGERREVALDDGSVLTVDPQTTMRVKLEQHSRHVVLERGRALFRVAKDASRPFVVQAGDTSIRAVGTAFVVDRLARRVTVTVAEGKVAIMQDSASMTGPVTLPTRDAGSATEKSHRSDDRKRRTVTSTPQPVLLLADEQFVTDAGGTDEPVRKVNSEHALAWTQGRLIFDNDTVQQAAENFNRYNRVQIRIADTALGSRPVSGIFNSSDPESFLAFIQTVAHVGISRHNEEIVVGSLPR